ncbi:aminotransferase class V-fold PLP-dependent enzyme [Agrobacterium cavarae]|uniref:aminotransferase class V-fold PLP-dependent enzyme n=1 Tax=Agrobacterium cavarae TaxID=2528239 RepID=UPI0035E3DCEB
MATTYLLGFPFSIELPEIGRFRATGGIALTPEFAAVLIAISVNSSDRTRTELEPAYLAAISLANPPSDFIARPDDIAPAPTSGRFELGNFNLPAIQALGAALDLINELGVEKIQAHCFDLGDRLIAGLDELGVGLVGPRDRSNRAPHIYVAALPADDWIDYFASNDVRVSPERDGVRISLGMFNTEADIDCFLAVVKERGSSTGRSSKAT